MLHNQPVTQHRSTTKSPLRSMASNTWSQRLTGIDYGLDNFSYDPGHLSSWQVPSSISAHLPSSLLLTLHEWQLAGAAVNTSLDRIAALDSELLSRGYPLQTIQHLTRHHHHHHLRRGAIPPLTTIPDTPDTPLTSCPVSPTEAQCFTLSKLKLDHKPPIHPLTLGPGIDSPPITPVDSLISSTPDEAAQLCLPPDADALAGRLSPLFRDRLDSSASSSSALSSVVGSGSGSGSSTRSGSVGGLLGWSEPEFDRNAWETYANAYRAEVEELKARVWPRVKGREREVVKGRLEADDGDEDALEEFDVWWKEMRERLVELEMEVGGQRVPSVQRMKEERLKRGLYV